jgi:hypothetical protein
MKKLFKKYLREKVEGDLVKLSWYRISFFDFVAVFLISCLGMYLVAEQLGWEELRGLRIVPTNILARVIMYGTIALLTLYLTLNRKSILTIQSGRVNFNKRKITGKNWEFSRKEISNINCKLQKVYYENEVGIYPDTYTVSIHLKNGKKINVGSFNEEDCDIIKKHLSLRK